MTDKTNPPAHESSLVDFMRQSPLYGSEDIQFERDRSLPREVNVRRTLTLDDLLAIQGKEPLAIDREWDAMPAVGREKPL